MISTANINSKTIFGKTNVANLKQYVREMNADALVFGVDILSPYQHHYYRECLNIEVYDRFSIVLKIFRERASTKETKLQLSLAEIQYVRKNLHKMKECDFSQFTIASSFGGGFDTFYQIKKKLIQEQESKLNTLLEKVELNNQLNKHHRLRMQIPSVAIIGYTNCGKTSLIKSLTHDSKLKPEDKLFATLNVSTHQVNLPSNLKVLLIDTIGFITEIPTALIHSFRSTLSEISSADMLVHVTDCSHPDYKQQIETVHKTLRDLEVPEKLISTMLEVHNKVDKLGPDIKLENEDCLLISATERIGLDELKQSIEKGVINNTDRLTFDIRVPNGGEQYQWLYREVSVVECNADERDGNYIVMKVIITKSQLGKFMKHFRRSLRAS
ncbi:hypothetical protein RDWZM_003574 [Blomia tropicalis]|uniref:Hflx-type G domain-containing protein n=1 Tax=Blomia tropicalis TaxID=40697 RepID=A0A9Q0MFT9_BLOTA|nr:hypothetical protein RDWZM_003574 [Blomia tropicalis]